jgi:hypothetical protein
VVVSCPHCRRAIRITAADLQAAAAGMQLKPMQPTDSSDLELVPMESQTLRPAGVGSEVGLTGQREVGSDEVAASGAQQRVPSRPPVMAMAGGPDGSPMGRRGFVSDLVSSFWFAGQAQNAFNLLAVAAGLSVPLIAASLLGMVFGLFGAIIGLLFVAFAVVYAVQFYWRTMTDTAGGEDNIPLIQADVDIVDDAVKPAMWMLVITLACTFPAILTYWYAPDVPWRQAAVLGVLGVGSLLWPMALLSVAIGQNLAFLRPDWLVRSIVAVGPVYLLACAQTAAVLVALYLLLTTDVDTGLPSIVQFVYMVLWILGGLYLGYVLFRTLGLLYRHFGHRFPWQF